ncbi:IS1182 family transposase [Mesobacillus jeotgali]|uniref:IS1182 family transposase n=1 Tax=Mesobacillus jeotgali TaxID=129985 RepID=A0ABY9VHN7_9BACI|nr:IS1182 family transposase [Mesobacillus jeotgali]WNF22720.1 IS1182 family transposase [Mesobacillus jeotgali]WNF23454.1 IS1182 family transposase [Mesobacillus jeotgali]
MLKDKDMQLSIYSVLYNKIPENHKLKLLKDVVDFSFINDKLEKSYCKYYGRPAKEPELMVKLLVLQYLYNLSDEQVIEEASLNLAFMYFLGINPEDDLPHPSLLAKFRKHKLEGNLTIDEIIVEINKQGVEKGILKSSGISIDTTHSEANTFKCTAERVMKRLAKKIFKTVEEECGEVPKEINQDIPDYKEIEDHKEAKATMKSYLEETISNVEEHLESENIPKTKRLLENAKEILQDPKFIEQKGVRSIVDQDARVGHKSKTSHFFGYKTEFMITTEDRIITAVHVGNGAYVDGEKFDQLLELTKKSGMTIDEVYGDKAYFRKPILDKIKEAGAKPYIPVSEMAYKIDEDLYSYNKDSDEWFCVQGNQTVRKVHQKKKSGKQSYKYYFEREKCRVCPLRDQCVKGTRVGRILDVGINTPEFYGYSQEQKTDEFKVKYKKRACQEWKNGEMKNFHGLDRARGYGLKSMGLQAKLTALAVNLKRIAKILSSNKSVSTRFIVIYFKIPNENLHFLEAS